jgi:PilZ domain
MGIPDLEAVEEHSEAAERRTEPRVNMDGQPVLVDAGDGREHVTCYIVNLSKRGACIMTPKGVALPYSFKLSIEGRWRNADTVWNRWPQLGIRFVK